MRQEGPTNKREIRAELERVRNSQDSRRGEGKDHPAHQKGVKLKKSKAERREERYKKAGPHGNKYADKIGHTKKGGHSHGSETGGHTSGQVNFYVPQCMLDYDFEQRHYLF